MTTIELPTQSEQPLPAGYRQGLISAITVLLGFSLLFLRFVVFEPASGPWTRLGAISASLVSVSTIVQLFALWRALQPADDKIRVYTVTVRWFVAGILILGASLAVDAVTSVVYGQWASPMQTTIPTNANP